MRGKKLTTRSHAIETVRVEEESRIRLALNRVRALRKRNYVEDLAIKSDTGLSKLTETRRRLFAAVVLSLITNGFVWLASMSFPHEASSIL